MKIQWAELHGGIDDKDGEMKRFRTDENCRILIANQKSGGIGVNLVEAPVSIFYSRNFSLEEDIQAEARNYRGGSTMHEKVTRYDLIATNSIDELIADALENKQALASSILDIRL
jgi:SNF2 family DNA or RNA helicase